MFLVFAWLYTGIMLDSVRCNQDVFLNVAYSYVSVELGGSLA